MCKSSLASGDPREEARGRGSAAGLGATGEGPRQERRLGGSREDPEPRGASEIGRGGFSSHQAEETGLGAQSGVLPALLLP